MSTSSFIKNPCRDAVIEDFIRTVNANNGCITEVAFADPGSSRFNSALYFAEANLQEISGLLALKSNIAFANGLDKSKMEGLVFNQRSVRKGSDANIKVKNILSFDLDFKANVNEYRSEQRSELLYRFSSQLKEKLHQHHFPLWLMVMSGNGIHLHCKLYTAYTLKSVQTYKRAYDAIRCYLECITGLKFDPACSNPSRLMRLPFSTNWKDSRDPVYCNVICHDQSADFSPMFEGFKAIAEPKLIEVENTPLQEIHNKIDFKKILTHFGYGKFETIKESEKQIICSSPFNSDSNPSFFYDRHKRVFYDFSSGFGGDLITLISRMAGLDRQKNYAEILEIAENIADIRKKENGMGGFELNETGLWYRSSDNADPLWLSSPIFVEALTRDAANQSWGRLLTFKDQDGVAKSWSMPMELLAGDGSEIRRNLLSLGAELAVGKRERLLFISYLQNARPTSRARCVNRIGWHQNQFVLPNKIYSPATQKLEIILQESKCTPGFGMSGDISQWKENVAKLCAGNSRLVLAVSAGLASALLKWTGDESGGFNFYGPSSIGKSITLKVAASVWGNPGLNGFVKRWRSTVNGLELLAASRCDALLVLDELGEILPKDAGNVSYMLCGGLSKNRATKNIKTANQLEWRLLFLSSGELTLASHVTQSGAQTNVGQEVRMLDIPAETASSQGIFEHLHDFESSAVFASQLAENAERFFGSAIDDFLTKIVGDSKQLMQLTEIRKNFADRIKENGNQGQIQRALKRFSLVAGAGELGIILGTLPWGSGEAIKAAEKCFYDWRSSWGSCGNRERQQLLQQIKQLLQEFGPSRFPILQDFTEFKDTHCQQLWGFRRKNEDGNFEWLILSEIFRSVFCKGHDYRRALRDLRDEHYLITSSTGQSSIAMRLPHLGVARVSRINSSILA